MQQERALFEENVVPTCKICGRRMAKSRESELCHGCEEHQLFCAVRDYIRENDVKDYEVAAHFQIPVGKVKHWIREGRIQYKERVTPQTALMSNYCQVCGKPTNFGTICTDCMRERQRKKKHGVAIGAPNKGEHNRMQFIEEEGHGRK